MSVDGVVLMTPELWEKVSKEMSESAKRVGISLQEYAVINYAILDAYFKKQNMKMEIFRDNSFERKEFKKGD